VRRLESKAPLEPHGHRRGFVAQRLVLGKVVMGNARRAIPRMAR